MEDLPSGSRSQTSIAPRSTETVSIETSYLQSGVQAAAGLVTLLLPDVVTDVAARPRAGARPTPTAAGAKSLGANFGVNCTARLL